MEGIVSMLDPHNPSISKLETLNREPYLRWIKGAKNADECWQLINLLSGIPQNWVTWADSKIAKRGNSVYYT
jgi:hypothetical protein